ncbi:MAG: hypothetical protein R3C11_21105 [Planctomycetaceae bacterium]
MSRVILLATGILTTLFTVSEAASQFPYDAVVQTETAVVRSHNS